MSSGITGFVERRKLLNLTQKQVGDAVGVTSRTVQSWELGENVPRLTLDKTLRLCKALNCSLEELVSYFYPDRERIE
jgi:transcriptional regulator with XRE-family HTH domain